MRLLNQRETNDLNQKNLATQLREGESLAKEVDKLRITLSKEQTKTQEAVRKIQTNFIEFCRITDEKKSELESEVKRLEERKKIALEPLIRQKAELEQIETDLDNRKSELKELELDLKLKTDQLEIEKSILKKTKKELEEKQEKLATERLYVTSKLHDLALEDKLLGKRDKDVRKAEKELAKKVRIKEYQLKVEKEEIIAKQRLNQQKEKELNLREKAINDKYETLLRTQNHVRKRKS